MKVLLINGSAHTDGSTHHALLEVQSALRSQDIETEMFEIGKDGVVGCIGCGACAKSGAGKCLYRSDKVNELIERAKESDGFIVGSPVYYASAAGNLFSLLDRAFYAGSYAFKYKPAAAVVCCRRGGASASFDALNKYFTINQMPVVSSQYWNSVHGAFGDQVTQDAEGMQTVRTLGYNMAWLLKCIEKGRESGIVPFSERKTERTNFIR